jgi:hypothetical protein
MGRPERPLDPEAGPIARFAADLRELRQGAGSPKYLQMARATGRSRTALAEAAGGDHLPTWETVEAFVTACQGDALTWRARWERAQDAARVPVDRTVADPPTRTVVAPALEPETPSATVVVVADRPSTDRRRRGAATGIAIVLVLTNRSRCCRVLASEHS